MSTTELLPWQELAARVMDALANAQDRTNAAYPEHVKCYPSWERKPRHLRWLAEMFRTGRPTGNGAGQPDVLAALAATQAAAPGMVSVKQVDANNYCRILAALGMEEDGDPVAKVRDLLAPAEAVPLPALPTGTTTHMIVGDLFDQRQMHRYAIQYAEACGVKMETPPVKAAKADNTEGGEL
ncbi:hypothetical protein [Comamonas testosteroni]|uniref:hypothetical protein n=1 Tax=Comamonas testosteroni TaxID=285 RepID=UPI0026EA6CA3|nr:hypothetical protein [Comamonas testosteroni]